MTARVLTGRTLDYFLYRLRELKTHAAIVCVSALLSYPSMALFSALSERASVECELARASQDSARIEKAIEVQNNASVSESTASLIGFIALIIMIFMSLPALMKSFRYLHNKLYLDMDMLLPLSHSQRFTADLLSAFSAVMIPQLISVIAGAVIYSLLTPGGWVAGEAFFYSRGWLYLGVSIMFFCSCIFVISLCGKTSYAWIMCVLYNILLPLSGLLLTFTAYSSGWGTSVNEAWAYFPRLIGASAGLGMLFKFMSLSGRDDPLAALAGDGTLIVAALFAALYVFAAYRLIKNRRCELTGSPFAYKAARHAFHFIIVFAMSTPVFFMLYSNSSNYRMWSLLMIDDTPAPVLVAVWLVLSLATYLVSEYFCGIRIKKLAPALGRYAAMAAVSAFLCFAVTQTDAFGRAGYVPDPGNIDSASVYINGSRGVSGETDDPQALTSLHRRILETRELSEKDEKLSRAFYISIGCNEKNGAYILREYYVSQSLYEELSAMAVEAGVFRSHYKMPEDTVGKPEFTDNFRVSVLLDEAVTHGPYNTRGETIFDVPITKLYEAMEKDTRELSFEDIYRGAVGAPEYITVYGWANGTEYTYTYNIYKCFTNTRSLLEQCGLELFGDSGYIKAYLLKCTATTDNVYSQFIDGLYNDDGQPDPSLIEEKVRELTREDAQLLTERSAQQTLYRESGDAYKLILVRRKNYTDYSLLDTESVMVIEDFKDEAAEIWAASAPADGQELAGYLSTVRVDYENYSEYIETVYGGEEF